MKADNFDTPTNPYHYVLHCIGGKWKMTILHEIYTYGSIRFNQTLKILPISEKVFSQQLKELVEAGLIRRISYDTVPPKVEYVLTPSGEQLIPALDILYIWSIRQMHDRRIPIDADAFVVHKSGEQLLARAGAPARRGAGRGVNVYCVIIGNYKETGGGSRPFLCGGDKKVSIALPGNPQ